MPRDFYEDEDARKAVCDWLRANDVDPGRIPFNAFPSMADGRLTLLEKVRNAEGRDIIEGGGVMTRTITVPVKVPPSPIVEEWLQPRCETCGR